MDNYYRTLLEILDEPGLQRRTYFATGHEAIYRDGQFICGDGEVSEDAGLVESLTVKPHLVLFGCGHVGKALYDLAVLQDMRTTVLDSRTEILTEERFPKAERICGTYEELLQREYGSFFSPYYCIFTHGHVYDAQCLYYALTHRHSYIGMIGSAAKIAYCMQAMRDSGITEDQLKDVCSPIGLPINAVTPQEIAVAIMAQIIGVFRADKKAVDMDPSVIALAAEKPGVMVRIVGKTGSAPRSVGSMMYVTADGFRGTVGGGAIERHAIDRARQLLADQEDFLLEENRLSGKDPLGMICGGTNTLLYRLVRA
ncbi:MAG: XdhC family protein [Spirochaetales bacterium]|nr:XdhC family protein [Spirochaetales bacterium]